MAPIGACAVLALAVVLPAAGGPAYHGGFPALAVVTGLLLLGVQQPGPVTAMLATAPLVALGKISYGVYLYHFPTYVLMSPQRTGQSGTALLVMRVAVTLVVSAVSYVVLERPIRAGTFTIRRTVIGSTMATAGVFGLAMLVPIGTSVYYQPDPDLVEAAAIQPVAPDQPASISVPASTVPESGPPSTVVTTSTGTPATVDTVTVRTTDAATTTSTTLPALGRPARILVVGDSTAQATGAGMVALGCRASRPDAGQPGGSARLRLRPRGRGAVGR